MPSMIELIFDLISPEGERKEYRVLTNHTPTGYDRMRELHPNHRILNTNKRRVKNPNHSNIVNWL